LASRECLISSIVTGSLALAVEGVEEGAVEAGLPRTSARTFARQAMLGSALLMQDVGESPAALKDRVASPAGTTIAGLAALEDRGTRGALIRAVEMGVLGEAKGRDK
jgi:pyrroline-5-carboxylate reductase